MLHLSKVVLSYYPHSAELQRDKLFAGNSRLLSTEQSGTRQDGPVLPCSDLSDPFTVNPLEGRSNGKSIEISTNRFRKVSKVSYFVFIKNEYINLHLSDNTRALFLFRFSAVSVALESNTISSVDKSVKRISAVHVIYIIYHVNTVDPFWNRSFMVLLLKCSFLLRKRRWCSISIHRGSVAIAI